MKTTVARCTAFLVLLFLATACTELRQAASTVGTWARNYSFGSYRATPQQTRVAHERASRHYERLPVAKKKAMRESGKRYLAVRTLDPSPQQMQAIKKNASKPKYTGASGATYTGPRRGPKPPPSHVNPAPKGPWHCVMIWDTYAKQVVGNDCYAVNTFPPEGETARFDTFAAVYIGDGP